MGWEIFLTITVPVIMSVCLGLINYFSQRKTKHEKQYDALKLEILKLSKQMIEQKQTNKELKEKLDIIISMIDKL